MNTTQKTYKHIFAFVQLILIAFVATSIIKAQTSGVDLTFNAVPDKNATTATNFILQPDDKIIAFGDFIVVRGIINNRIARLNPDGSVDNTFNCAVCDFTITSAVAQPDGKIIIAGSSGGFNGQSRLFRLNADGSLDASFASPFPAVTFPERNSADVRAVLPNGKILVVLIRSSGSFVGYTLNRLNPNGAIDNTFTAINLTSTSGGFFSAPGKISVQPDGKILAAINNSSGASGSSGFIRRYNADGSIDSTFESPSLTNSAGSFVGTRINDFDVQADGGLIIAGRFTTVNGVSRLNAVKLMSVGNVDLSFNNSISGEVVKVKILPDGKVLLATSSRIFRLNADGSLDNSFVSPTNITLIYNFILDSAGRIVLYALFSENGVPVNKFVRLNLNGGIESSFEPNFGVVGSTTAIAAQPDGKIVFAGDFLRVNGVPSVSIARVNSDGSLDPTFNVGTGVNGNLSNGSVSKILIQADGKILLAGTIFSYNGTPRLGLVRLNADGSLDANFNPTITFISFIGINSIALQNDGKIIIAGNFNAVNGQARTGIARLNADGSLDASFNPTFGSYSIISVFVQADGKIMVGGTFSGVNGFSRSNLVRLNGDGSLDSAFNAGGIAPVRQVEPLADGRYLILTGTILRLNNNGATDTTFLSPIFQSSALQFFAQPDGSILVGGNFLSVNNTPRLYFARLRPNGALDSSFFPTGANGAVRTIVRQANGQILVGGDFSIIGGVTRLSIARLNVAPYRLITPYDYDGDGRADVAVFRPSNGNWYILPSQNNAFYGFPFGQAGDRIAPADYDGDGKTDIAVFRDVVPGAGNFAYFYILNSADNSFRPVQFGATGDIPVSGDWDGDGKADLAVYRDGSLAGGQSYFYYRPSSQPSVSFVTIPLGITGDKPLLGDFDGDGRLDPAVFRPSNAVWYILRSSVNQITQTTFGTSTDIPVPADYDGDGQTNIAVFRPSNGTWYTSINPQNNFGAVQFGANGDLPVPADYDGDGRADVAVFRPSNGAWYLLRSTQGFTGVSFGDVNDKPIPNAYVR